MYLKSILPAEIARDAQWSIYATCDPEGISELGNFLAEQPANMRKYATGMLALLGRVAVTGPQQLPDDLCHQVSKGVWEFIKGRIRVFWFYDEGKVIVCSHGHIKRTQKTPASEIMRVEGLIAQYFEAKKKQKIIQIEEE